MFGNCSKCITRIFTYRLDVDNGPNVFSKNNFVIVNNIENITIKLKQSKFKAAPQ